MTPASTLYNWTQEFTKFMPAFRIVPYWGSPAERKILRRFWSVSGGGAGAANDAAGAGGLLGTRGASFHVVVTSYQVVLQDAKFINKTAWTYIVLDEAHAIKSTSRSGSYSCFILIVPRRFVLLVRLPLFFLLTAWLLIFPPVPPRCRRALSSSTRLHGCALF